MKRIGLVLLGVVVTVVVLAAWPAHGQIDTSWVTPTPTEADLRLRNAVESISRRHAVSITTYRTKAYEQVLVRLWSDGDVDVNTGVSGSWKGWQRVPAQGARPLTLQQMRAAGIRP